MLVAVAGVVVVAEAVVLIREAATAQALAASPGGRLRQRRQEGLESGIRDIKRRL